MSETAHLQEHAEDPLAGDYDELHDDQPEPKAEDKYDFTEEDLDDRKGATKWLEDVAAAYEKQAEKFGRVKGDPDKKGVSHYASAGLSVSEADAKESKVLSRALENGFYATSDDNVYSALHTIETGVLHRADYFSTWPDGSYKAGVGIKTTELDLDGLRAFTNKFAELQRQRDEAIAKGGVDPLRDQMQEVFDPKYPPKN